MRARKKRQWQFEAFDPASFRAEFDSIYKDMKTPSMIGGSMQAGRELDALVAERVMGLPSVMRDDSDGEWLYRDNHPILGWSFVPCYSTSIADAWMVVEKLSNEGHRFFIERFHDGNWGAAFCKDNFNYWHEYNTAPLVICVAALEAVGVEVA